MDDKTFKGEPVNYEAFYGGFQTKESKNRNFGIFGIKVLKIYISGVTFLRRFLFNVLLQNMKIRSEDNILG